MLRYIQVGDRVAEGIKRRPIGVFSAKDEDEDDSEESTVAVDESSEERLDIRHSLKPFFVLWSQMGILPLTMTTKAQRVSFDWLSLSMLRWAILLTLVICVNVLVSMWNSPIVPSNQVEFLVSKTRNTVFRAGIASTLIFNVPLARKLPRLLDEWEAAGVRAIVISRRKAMVVTGSVVLVMAVCHSFYILAVGNCSDEVKLRHIGFLKCHFENNPAHFNTLFDYSWPLTIAIIISEVLFAYTLYFPAMFTILLSLALSENFKAIAADTRNAMSNADGITAHKWKTLREDHLSMCRLLNDLDDVVSPLVLIAYTVITYFLSDYAYSSIRKVQRKGSLVQSIFFWLAFLFLFVVLFSMTAAGNRLTRQVRKPLKYLLRCPEASYCSQVARFEQHIQGATTGFTGFQMFTVNREIILPIFAWMFTFVLMLLNAVQVSG